MSKFEDSNSDTSNNDTEDDEPLINLKPVAAANRPNVYQFQAPSGRIWRAQPNDQHQANLANIVRQQ